MNTERERIVILGGGLSGMSAAFWLSEEARLTKREYEITVYQPGWRLGGKCASGRNAGAGQRIEEPMERHVGSLEALDRGDERGAFGGDVASPAGERRMQRVGKWRGVCQARAPDPSHLLPRHVLLALRRPGHQAGRWGTRRRRSQCRKRPEAPELDRESVDDENPTALNPDQLSHTRRQAFHPSPAYKNA